MKEKLIDFMDFLYQHFVGIILIMTLIVVFSWLGGFWIGPFYNIHFELSSCGTIILAIATAAATGWGKWVVDSKLNTPKDIMPEIGVKKEENKNETSN